MNDLVFALVVFVPWMTILMFVIYRATRPTPKQRRDRTYLVAGERRTLDNTTPREWVGLISDAMDDHKREGRNSCGHEHIDLDCASCVLMAWLTVQDAMKRIRAEAKPLDSGVRT